MSAPEAAARLATARRDFAEGRAAQAAAACRELLERSPTMAGALHLLGLIALQEAQPNAAEEFLRRAIEAPEVEAIYLVSYAQLCLGERAPAEALALTRRAVELEPRSALAWYSLGSQLLGNGAVEQSRACFERALEHDPRRWQARAQLGVVLARLGLREESDRCFETLLREEAGNAAALDVYAGCLADQGRLDEAAIEAAHALAAAPEALEQHLRAAQIDLRRRHIDTALARLESLRTRWPRDPRPVALLLVALQSTDRAHEAIDVAATSLAQGVESPDLLLAYGSALHVAGRDEEALRMLERARQDRPAAALNERGIVLSDLGRFAEAQAAFEQALSYQPTLVHAWYNKARAKRFVRDDPDLGALERLLEQPGSHEDQMLAHFALGKAYDESGDPERAFLHWRQGNALKRATLSYDSQAALRELELDAARVGLTGAAPVGAGTSEAPVFIVGMPRCGSTLLEQMLASHPEVASAGEQSGARAQIEHYAASRSHTSEDARTAAACAATALVALRRFSPTAARILDKDLRNFRYLDLIHRLFPRARIIHCRRDPLDTCFSAYTLLFAGDFPYAYDLRELGGYYAAYRDLMQIWRERLPAHILLEIDYEALIEEPRVVCERLLSHLGLPWSEACLSFHESGRSIRTASLMQTRRPLYRSSVGRSARYAAELEPLIEALARDGDRAKVVRSA